MYDDKSINGDQFLKHHLKEFLSIATPGKWTDGDPNKWMLKVPVKGLSSTVLEFPLSRERLKSLAKNSSICDRDILWAILCWGRMRHVNARRFLPSDEIFFPIISQLRSGQISRYDAYAGFYSAIDENCIRGIGPAYYTKLIYFAGQANDGYIMDRWTSKSVNLLMKQPFIKISSGYVSNQNNADVYESYCRTVEALTRLRGEAGSKTPGEETEMCLFSTGGRNPDEWRRHVLKHSKTQGK